jgi:hypothetical protein
MTEYKFYREGTGWETVAPERWRWVATYTDGTALKQFDDNGIFHQFREIEQDRLARFDMVCEGKQPIVLQWSHGRKLIHFYTNTILRFGASDERRFRVYCFGYEEGKHKLIVMIMPDDGIVITDDHNRVKVA